MWCYPEWRGITPGNDAVSPQGGVSPRGVGDVTPRGWYHPISLSGKGNAGPGTPPVGGMPG